jgi:hypothetical protein
MFIRHVAMHTYYEYKQIGLFRTNISIKGRPHEHFPIPTQP